MTNYVGFPHFIRVVLIDKLQITLNEQVADKLSAIDHFRAHIAKPVIMINVKKSLAIFRINKFLSGFFQQGTDFFLVHFTNFIFSNITVLFLKPANLSTLYLPTCAALQLLQTNSFNLPVTCLVDH